MLNGSKVPFVSPDSKDSTPNARIYQKAGLVGIKEKYHMLPTGHIFSLKIHIDSCSFGLPWDHWAQTNTTTVLCSADFHN